MIIDEYGQSVYDDDDIFESLMRDEFKYDQPGPFLVQNSNIDATNRLLGYNAFIKYEKSDISVQAFDELNQAKWFMPDVYKEMDIAKHILELCDNDAELQRCGQELILYQDRGLFDLLRYLTFFVNTMEKHNIIWGVGRGSSVASFILYKLRIHRINSMFYGLEIEDFLR